MPTIRTLLLSTAVAAVVGASALSGAYAQTTAPSAAPAQTAPATAPAQPVPQGGYAVRGVLPRLTCDANAAGQLETRFTQAATQLVLTAEQQPLFEAYKTAALSAQTSFADACAKVQPQAAGTTATDMLTMMKNRQAVRTAEVEAVNTVLPSFEAFYNGLSDAQKALLAPQGHHGQNGPDRAGRGRMGNGHGGMQQGQGGNDGQGFGRDGRGRGGNQGFQGRGGHHGGGGFGNNGPRHGFPGQLPTPPVAPAAPATPAPAAPAPTAG